MSIIDHESAAEEVRRPGYRRRRLAGYDDGFELTFDYHIVDPGAGAPDHHHDVDELIVVLEGEVDAITNGVTERINPLQTLAIPTGAHHGFTVVGTKPAKLLVFFPVTDAFTDKAHDLFVEQPISYRKSSKRPASLSEAGLSLLPERDGEVTRQREPSSPVCRLAWKVAMAASALAKSASEKL